MGKSQMGVKLEFNDKNIEGFVDSSQPANGWLLSTGEIEKVWIELTGRIIKCEYGITRPDVPLKIKPHNDIKIIEKCGFREAIPAENGKYSKIIFIKE